jgi:hypothetical protein
MQTLKKMANLEMQHHPKNQPLSTLHLHLRHSWRSLLIKWEFLHPRLGTKTIIETSYPAKTSNPKKAPTSFLDLKEQSATIENMVDDKSSNQASCTRKIQIPSIRYLKNS